MLTISQMLWFFLMLNYDEPEIINVGSGEDQTIGELALAI